MAFPDGWSYYKTRNIKRASGALSNWQARLVIAEGSSDVIGSELVTNGDGESTTGWSTWQCSVASVDGGHSGKCFQITDAASSGGNNVYRSVAALYGHRYRMSGYVKSGTSGDEAYRLYLNPSGGPFTLYAEGVSSSTWTYFYKDFVQPFNSPVFINFTKDTSTNGTMLFDEISVKEIADITLEGHAKTDFGDLRFSNSANGPLDYFIDHIDGTTPNQVAYVDVEIDSVATSDTQVKCWYGNSSATSESSAANTFIVGDDFERGNDGDAVGGDWTVVQGTVEIDTAQAYAGTRSARVCGGSTTGSATIPMTAASGEYTITVRTRKTANAGPVYPTLHGNGTNRIAYRCETDEKIMHLNSAGGAVDTGYTCTADAWMLFEVNNIDFSAGTYDLYHNGALVKSSVEMQSHAETNVIRAHSSDTTANDDFWIDNLIVRNWRSTPPEWQGDGWSAEQENSGSTIVFLPHIMRHHFIPPLGGY